MANPALLLAALATAPAPAAAAPPSALRPVPIEAAAQAACACIGKTHDLAAGRAALKADGWREADGAGTEGLYFFSKGGIVLLLDPAKDGDVSCSQTVEVGPAADADKTLAAYDAAFRARHEAAPGDKTVWLTGGEAAFVAITAADDAGAIQGIRLMVVNAGMEGAK